MKGRTLWRRWLRNPATRHEPWSAWDYLAANLRPQAHAEALGVSKPVAYTIGDAVRRRSVVLLLRLYPRVFVILLLCSLPFAITFIEPAWGKIAWMIGVLALMYAVLPSQNTRFRRLILMRTTRERTRSIAAALRSDDQAVRLQAECDWIVRSTQWRTFARGNITDDVFRTLHYRDSKVLAGIFMGLVVFSSMAFNALVPFRQGPWWKSYLMPIGMLAYFGVLLAVRSVEKHRLRRLLVTLDGKACPGCAYPLEPEMVPSLRKGEGPINLGPPRCPECGCRWPLVPPIVSFDGASSTPAEATNTLQTH